MRLLILINGVLIIGRFSRKLCERFQVKVMEGKPNSGRNFISLIIATISCLHSLLVRVLYLNNYFIRKEMSLIAVASLHLLFCFTLKISHLITIDDS